MDCIKKEPAELHPLLVLILLYCSPKVMDKTLIDCVGNLVNDDQFSLDFVWAIDVVEFTSYFKSGIPELVCQGNEIGSGSYPEKISMATFWMRKLSTRVFMEWDKNCFVDFEVCFQFKMVSFCCHHCLMFLFVTN